MAFRAHDPHEGLTPEGIIRTGADRRRIPAHYLPILDAVVRDARSEDPDVSVHVYGSVATGTARPPTSDVDVLTIGLHEDRASAIAARRSAEFADRCRGVEIGAASLADFEGDADNAYGGRAFLHHYCVLLAGPDRDRSTHGFRGDRRAARGFNGDIARHAARWQDQLPRTDPTELGRRVARKTLLAVAGLVSVHDGTWTTDRRRGAHRWAEIHPDLGTGLAGLLEWSYATDSIDRRSVERRLRDTVGPLVDQFAATIGLWDG